MDHNGHGKLAVYNNNDSDRVLLALTATYMGTGAEIIIQIKKFFTFFFKICL